MILFESVIEISKLFQATLDAHGYYQLGKGIKPWSTRYVNVMGNCVDLLGDEWTYYVDGEEVCTGCFVETLVERIK